MDKRHELGRRGEDLAADFLLRKNYKLIGRNVANRLGELDLVFIDGKVVVIVEVKTRASSKRAPSEAVGYHKQLKLTRAATLFLQENNWLDRSARFDVVEIIQAPGGAPVIRHIEDAFEPIGY